MQPQFISVAPVKCISWLASLPPFPLRSQTFTPLCCNRFSCVLNFTAFTPAPAIYNDYSVYGTPFENANALFGSPCWTLRSNFKYLQIVSIAMCSQVIGPGVVDIWKT